MRIVYILIIIIMTIPYRLSAEEEFVYVKGRVIYDGTLKGTVSFFNKDLGVVPDPVYYMRVPDAVFEIKSNGNFEGKVKPGVYYVGIIVNETGKKGPLKIGDKFYLLKKDEKILEFDFTGLKTYDFKNIEIFLEALKELKFKTAIKGRVVDENNKPIPNVYIFAFLEGKDSKKPAYISEPTDNNGKFFLRLGSGGRYILRARNVIDGGPPRQGYIIGTYGQSDNPRIIEIKDGEVISNIEIVVHSI